ncbi:hypothetical protein DFH09DRAFT_1090682 [Mycena vulgaris]|nr:hypothetical protein DFH09DRAFT_1090682 [Mycena vulgaris]
MQAKYQAGRRIRWDASFNELTERERLISLVAVHRIIPRARVLLPPSTWNHGSNPLVIQELLDHCIGFPRCSTPRYQELCLGFAELGLSAGSASIKTRFHLVEVFAQPCSVPFTHLRDVSIRRYSQDTHSAPTPIPHVLSISRICLESLEIGYLFVSDDWLAPDLSAFDLSELKFLRLNANMQVLRAQPFAPSLGMITALDFYATVGKFHKDRDLFVHASTQCGGRIIDLGLLPQLVLLRMFAMNVEAGEMMLDTALSTITQLNRNRSITIHSTNPSLYAELDTKLADLPMHHALTVELAMGDPRYGVIAHMHHFPRLLAKIWSES